MLRDVLPLWCAVALAAGLAPQPRAANGGLQLSYGVVAVTKDGQISVGKEGMLKGVQQLRIFLGHDTPSFAYLLREDTEERLTLMYPAAVGSDKPASGNHYLPSETKWFELAPAKGVEHLYIVASTTRLVALERLITDYRSASEVSRKKVRDAIIEEVARLSRVHAADPWSERPVPMGGQVRDPTDPPPTAIEVSGRAFLYRVVTIQRQ